MAAMDQIDGFYGRQGPGWEGRLSGIEGISGGGRVDGHAWSFRGWWGLWLVLIAEPRECADANLVGRGVAGWSASGQWSTPEMFMDANSAWSFVLGAFEALRAGTLARVEANAVATRAG